jgi:hypothetical protein
MSDTKLILWFTWFLASYWLQKLAIVSPRPATTLTRRNSK